MNSRRPRILLLSDSRAFHTERIVAELRRQGCCVLPASLEHGQLHHFHIRRRGPIKPLHYTLAWRQIRTLVERFRPDVINAHFASGYGHLAALALKSGGPPLVVNLWGSDILIVPHESRLHRRKTVRALRAADHVFADSEFLLRSARELTPIEQATVIPWGIESEYLRYHRTDYQIASPLRIIVPRTQSEIYNNHFLLDTLKPMIAAGKIAITFAGFGSHASQFRNAVGGLRDRGVTLYPRLARSEFMSLLAEHDVYLSASRSDSSPASMIESMALGLIPIAADIPGVREWLSDDNGFLFEQDNPEPLLAAVTSVMDSDGLPELRRANLKRVQQDAIFEDNVTTMLRVMKRLS